MSPRLSKSSYLDLGKGSTSTCGMAIPSCQNWAQNKFLPNLDQHRGRLCRRRSDCYAMDFHLLTDALQVLVVARHRARFDDVTDARRLHHRCTDANFVDIGETLHACGDIHILSEIVDPVVERHRNRPTPVHTDLEAQRPRSGLVEPRQFFDHLDGGANG